MLSSCEHVLHLVDEDDDDLNAHLHLEEEDNDLLILDGAG